MDMVIADKSSHGPIISSRGFEKFYGCLIALEVTRCASWKRTNPKRAAEAERSTAMVEEISLSAQPREFADGKSAGANPEERSAVQ